jgi:hypothetical protein
MYRFFVFNFNLTNSTARSIVLIHLRDLMMKNKSFSRLLSFFICPKRQNETV